MPKKSFDDATIATAKTSEATTTSKTSQATTTASTVVVETRAEPTIFASSVVEPEVENFIEKIVCDELELSDNEMKEFEIDDDKKILLIKQKGKFSAIGTKCSHYGAMLSMGALGEGRIRCPWHGACFNIETGDIEDFPGLDGIPCYQVSVEKGQVKVRAKKSQFESEKVMKEMATRDIQIETTYAIIGGGPSAQTCAETLRQNGFKGRIVMICKENYLPYDRTKLSKFLNTKIDDIQLRNQLFYDKNQIEVMLNITATSLNLEKKEISLSNDTKVRFGKAFIATGSTPRLPSTPGVDLRNILTLRNLDDAKEINSKLNEKSHVVVLGSSFIGLEIAAYCVDKVAKVTIIGRSSVPLIDSFGEAIGSRIMELFKSKNVEFIMNSGIMRFIGDEDGNIKSVELRNNQELKADICIIGIGSVMNTEFLQKSGLIINKNGTIDTNLFLQTNISDVYVGGDIANSPIFSNNDELASIGHYSLAQYHGKVAALNMVGMKTELNTVPYFSTYLFGNFFTYTGHGEAAEIFIEGELETLKFVAFYFDNDENVIAMSSCQPDKSIAEFAEKLAQGYKFHKTDIEWISENAQEI